VERAALQEPTKPHDDVLDAGKVRRVERDGLVLVLGEPARDDLDVDLALAAGLRTFARVEELVPEDPLDPPQPASSGSARSASKQRFTTRSE